MAPLLIPLGVVGSGKLEPSEYWLSVGSSTTNVLTYLSEKDDLGNSYGAGIWTNDQSNFASVVIKRDFMGEPLWGKAYSYNQAPADLFPTVSSSGDIFLSGSIKSSSATNYRGGFIKVNSSGTSSLARVIGDGQDTVYGTKCSLDSSGNIYLSISYNIYDNALLKFNSAGTLQWGRQYVGQIGADNIFRTYSVNTEASTGSTYIAGYSESGGFQGTPVLIKINSSGTFQWARYLSNSNNVARVESSILDSSGNVYISGSANNYAAGYIAKFNSSGTLQWQKQFAGSVLLPVLSADANAIYAIMRSNGTTILKFDLSGNLIWQRAISNYSSFYDLQIMSIDVNNDMFIPADLVNSSYRAGMLKLPNDGSLTGTHGPITYSVASLSVSDFSGTWTSFSPSVTTATVPTISSFTAHEATPTITYTREDVR